jgi:hypothetical protein
MKTGLNTSHPAKAKCAVVGQQSFKTFNLSTKGTSEFTLIFLAASKPL